MLCLQDILSFPDLLSHRNETIKNLSPRLLDFDKRKENQVIFYGRIDDHSQIIEIQSDQINKFSNVKIYCDCSSFYYEFAYFLNNANSLYHPDKFKKAIKKKPAKENPVTGCKHCIAFANHLFRMRSRINPRLKIN
ncbi:MAG: hypothetical protein ACOC1K_01875 [Nanoarchaeota archaeon]